MHPHPAIIRFRRLPARYAPVIMPLILSLFMTFVVSAIATARNLGFVPAFPSAWMQIGRAHV